MKRGTNRIVSYGMVWYPDIPNGRVLEILDVVASLHGIEQQVLGDGVQVAQATRHEDRDGARGRRHTDDVGERVVDLVDRHVGGGVLGEQQHRHLMQTQVEALEELADVDRTQQVVQSCRRTLNSSCVIESVRRLVLGSMASKGLIEVEPCR